MDKWYALTPQDVLLFGSENVIEGYIDDSQTTQSLIARSRKSYMKDSNVEYADFAYPFISAIAATEQYTDTSPINSLGRAMSFLKPPTGARISTRQTAIGFYNSIITAKFAQYAHDKLIAQKVTDAFLSGQLLRYPQDKNQLTTPAIIDKLPGIMRLMHTDEQVKNQSFQNYLRKGTPPQISDKMLWSNASKNKITCTSILELEFEQNLLTKTTIAQPIGTHEQGNEYLAVLEIIYDAMLQAEQAARDAASQHRRAFDEQIRDKFGLVAQTGAEPYLENEIKRFELQLLQTLERLALRMEKLLKDKKHEFPFPELKKINPSIDIPIPDQVREQTLLETNNMKGRMKRKLDSYRQQQIGIKYYRWRTMADEKVRTSHAANNGKIFAWDSPPDTGHPGEDYNCRCIAEPVEKDAGLPNDQLAFSITDGAVISGAALLIMASILKQIEQERREQGRPLIPSPDFGFEDDEPDEEENPPEIQPGQIILPDPDEEPPEEDPDDDENEDPKKEPKLNDTKTWPRPPTKGKLKEDLPSRNKPRSRGEKSLYDEK